MAQRSSSPIRPKRPSTSTPNASSNVPVIFMAKHGGTTEREIEDVDIAKLPTFWPKAEHGMPCMEVELVRAQAWKPMPSSSSSSSGGNNRAQIVGQAFVSSSSRPWAEHQLPPSKDKLIYVFMLKVETWLNNKRRA
ncbi:hypothetical protein Dimus_031336 [Dionaea muscipula]